MVGRNGLNAAVRKHDAFWQAHAATTLPDTPGRQRSAILIWLRKQPQNCVRLSGNTCLLHYAFLVSTLVVCVLDRFLIQFHFRTGTGCGAPEDCHMRTCCKRRRCCHEAGEPAGLCGAGGAVLSLHSDDLACLLLQCPHSCVCPYISFLCAVAQPPDPILGVSGVWPAQVMRKVLTVEVMSSGGCLRKSCFVALLIAPRCVRGTCRHRALE